MHPKAGRGFQQRSVQQKPRKRLLLLKNTRSLRCRWGENGNKTDGNSRNKPGGGTHPQLHVKVGWHLIVSTLTFVPHPHLYWVTNEREETKPMNVYRCMDSSFSLLSPISHTYNSLKPPWVITCEPQHRPHLICPVMDIWPKPSSSYTFSVLGHQRDSHKISFEEHIEGCARCQ